MSRIRVVTLNIWNKCGPWPERLKLIRQGLSELDAAIIGLQEVLRLDEGNKADVPEDQATDIAQGLGYEIAYGPASEHGDGLSFGNALLSRFPILEHRTVPLPGKESGETRSMLYALLDSPVGRLPVLVTHLNWKLHQGAVRLEQVRFIARFIDEAIPADDDTAPPILMGDLNASPDSDEIRYLNGLHTVAGESVFFADAWWFGGDGSPGYTFDRRNRFAAVAREPSRRIDYIFVRGPDWRNRGQPLEARVCLCTPSEIDGEPVWPSDHYGVMAEISF